ncbi:uncharacterized protein HRG_11059 [Hirsutella rhossiliensis]|uniref:Uncharacterized protein n=1 Tax=Hirsutella rhossiliensis TaxID=111463 RepID=A0A9P8SEF1_9HYPO|nr:uncharacterized protein HRG_11059 [Hirsutella rhossiliensis]KAH0957966.1 hypothetical protein HRG_11059 [Hirsutella rhossiliensis]
MPISLGRLYRYRYSYPRPRDRAYRRRLYLYYASRPHVALLGNDAIPAAGYNARPLYPRLRYYYPLAAAAAYYNLRALER